MTDNEHLWAMFRRECPVLSRIPLLRRSCFQAFADGYWQQKRDNARAAR